MRLSWVKTCCIVAGYERDAGDRPRVSLLLESLPAAPQKGYYLAPGPGLRKTGGRKNKPRRPGTATTTATDASPNGIDLP